jgi:UDP-N-acetylglucosamine--N-acetylmuramyl-(pentapeptide) pyrophosphoryl-undecaprenol N-acetylglucosamine transferase
LKILIACGSSGGHLLPALSFAEVLKERMPSEIHFLLARLRNWEAPAALKPFTVHWTGSFAWPRRFSKETLLFPYHFLKNQHLIWKVLRQECPELAVGFGGFVSFPAVLMAKLLGIPALIVEQNRIFGKANALLRFFADRVALSFPPQQKTSFRYAVTGNPLRKNLIEKAKNALYLEPGPSDKLSVLIVGGSQGARSLNRTLVETLKNLSREELSRIRITHLTGALNYEEVSRLYAELPAVLERRVLAFSDRMGELYRESHFVVSRSGAGTVFELMAFARPSLLIPYPHAESHQLQNAKYLETAGAADVIEEKDLTPLKLQDYLADILRHPKKLKVMAERSRELRVLDASERITELALSLLKRQN